MSTEKKKLSSTSRRRSGDIDPVVPEDGRRSRGRPKLMSDAEQTLIIARQAHNLFLEKGYGRTTMDDIVARCRISKSTLYRLFANKIEVFGAVIDSHRLSMLALPGDYDDLPIDEAIGRIFQVDIDDEADQRRIALIRFVIVEVMEFPEIGQLLHERGVERSRLELAKWLEAQKIAARIDIPDAYDAARTLMDLMFGAIISTRPPGVVLQWPQREERVRYLRSCIGLITRGILPRHIILPVS